MGDRGQARWDEGASAAENARRELPRLAAAYFASGRKAARKELPHRRLHGFRLETKRFRYTLELFLPLYGPGLERRIESLRQVQTRLGEVSDCFTIAKLFDGQERLASEARKQGARKIAAFRAHWKETFDTPGEERRWLSYLTRYAVRKRSTPIHMPLPST